MSLDFSRCRITPFKHQKEDVEWLIKHPYAFICSEMRTGKSAIVVWAAQFLFEAGKIDKVIVVAPAPVRDVWFDPDLGEISKHLWRDNNAIVLEFHVQNREWTRGDLKGPALLWITTNYEFISTKLRLEQLLPACGSKTLLVFDESSFVKNASAARTKSCMSLRRKCGRVVLLNGTPISHSPMDLFSQGNLLHPTVLACKFITHYKAKYAIQTPVLTHSGTPMETPYGKPVQSVIGWANLDDLERRFKPYTVRRMQADCLDLPPKLDPITLTATLTPESWRAYQDMKKELVVWLTTNTVATAATAAVKVMRLSQITSGFIGGVEQAVVEPDLFSSLVLPEPVGAMAIRDGAVELPKPVAIGHEKLDILLWFIEQRLEAEPNLHLVVWGRFRLEVIRAEAEVKAKFPQFETAVIIGGQPRDERLRALALLKPETSPKGPVFVAGIEGTGSFGLDFTASHTCVTMSSGYSPGRSAQTLDRVYGPGQTQPVAYFDIVAVGPKGQHTIDRDILIARRAGHDVAIRTAAAWVKVLSEE